MNPAIVPQTFINETDFIQFDGSFESANAIAKWFGTTWRLEDHDGHPQENGYRVDGPILLGVMGNDGLLVRVAPGEWVFKNLTDRPHVLSDDVFRASYRFKDVLETSAYKACAAAAHNVNRAWCIAHGDYSQPLWEDAPQWQVDSAVLGVHGVLAGNTPRQSHECWLEQKRLDGWKYGPVKDAEAKVHPCFVQYDALPPVQQAKDALFVATVRAVARELGIRA